MEQYIPKSALVAEIKRMKNYYENIQMIKPVYGSNIEDFNELLSFLVLKNKFNNMIILILLLILCLIGIFYELYKAPIMKDYDI